MTNLLKLKVSLTKHGAHKIGKLLKIYDKDKILKHLSGDTDGINIEMVQAKKNLSVDKFGKVPEIWNEVKNLGNEAIDALVLIAIIFSHHELIAAMKDSYNRHNFKGTVKRGKDIDGKAFTNFSCIVDELGYSVGHSSTYVRYDFKKIFKIEGIHKLVGKLLALKLKDAGWDGKNEIVEETTALGLNEVFSLSEDQFKTWITTGITEGVEFGNPKDEDFFFERHDDGPAGKFKFKPGHNAKKIGEIPVGASKGERKSILRHNELQNFLYESFVNKYGKDCVGTEVSTSNGTSIDVVVKTKEHCSFYEIKTACSVKACIRQAIPQLLEYAYWHGKNDRADRLIIVSSKKITPQAKVYLDFLKEKFKLPIDYEQFKLPKIKKC